MLGVVICATAALSKAVPFSWAWRATISVDANGVASSYDAMGRTTLTALVQNR